MQGDKQLECGLCKHIWEHRMKDELPKTCPKCKRYDWNTKTSIITEPIITTADKYQPEKDIVTQIDNSIKEVIEAVDKVIPKEEKKKPRFIFE